MKSATRTVVILALAAAVSVVLAVKARRGVPAGSSAALTTSALPRLVDLGADKCIPCKAMAPILAELRREYAGRMDVVFIDVWKDPDAAKPYGINLIPTQIFYDAAGKELWRHEGFLAKADMLAKWGELGVKL